MLSPLNFNEGSVQEKSDTSTVPIKKEGGLMQALTVYICWSKCWKSHGKYDHIIFSETVEIGSMEFALTRPTGPGQS